jgi:hypothetical protein
MESAHGLRQSALSHLWKNQTGAPPFPALLEFQNSYQRLVDHLRNEAGDAKASGHTVEAPIYSHTASRFSSPANDIAGIERTGRGIAELFSWLPPKNNLMFSTRVEQKAYAIQFICKQGLTTRQNKICLPLPRRSQVARQKHAVTRPTQWICGCRDKNGHQSNIDCFRTGEWPQISAKASAVQSNFLELCSAATAWAFRINRSAILLPI